MARKLIVEIVGDSRSLERAFDRSSRSAKTFQRDMDRTFRGVVAGSGAFRSLGRSVAFASSAFLGFAGLTAAVRAAFDEMAKAGQVTAQTNAAIKSTGGIAGVTAKQVDELANSMLRKTGIDDEATKTAENMLLTFTNVRNVVGANNDIFNQATQAVADMATRFNRGAIPSAEQMQAVAVRLGKALQDPIRGVGALRRVGVQFTDQQVKQIKTLVQSGRMLEAQKVILREVQTEFGGSAKAAGDTFGGALTKLRNIALNLGGDLAAVLAPSIQRVVDRLTKWLSNTRNQQRIQRTFNNIIRTASTVLARLWGIVKSVVDLFGGWGNTLQVLGGLWIAWKTTAIASTVAVTTANLVAAGVVERGWQAALVATGWGIFAVAAGEAAAFTITHWEKVKAWFQEFRLWLEDLGNRMMLEFIEPFTHIPGFVPGPLGRLGKWARGLKDDIHTNMEGIAQDFAAAEQAAAAAGKKTEDAFKFKIPKFPPPTFGAPPRGGTTGKQAAAAARDITATPWLDFQKAVAESTKTTLDDLRVVRQIIVVLTKRLALATTLKDRTVLLTAINQWRAEEQQITEAITESNRQAREAAKAAREAAAERERQRRTRRQFAALRLGPTGEDIVPGVENLRKRFADLRKRLKGTGIANARMIEQIGKVLAGRFGKVTADVRSKIDEMFDQWADALKQGRDTFAKFKPVDASKFVRGLGLDLSPAQTRRLIGAVAGISRTGKLPPSRTAAFAGAGGVTIHNANFYGVQNMSQLENELHKRAKARPQTRRGAR